MTRVLLVAPVLCLFVAAAIAVPSIASAGGNTANTQVEDQEALAENLTTLFRAYRATITKHKAAIQTPHKFFTKENIDARIQTMHKQAKILYKVATKKAYPTDDNVLRKSLETAFAQVLRDFVDGKIELTWKGKNDYVKKWDGKLLPARFAANAAKKFNEITKGAVTIKLTTAKGLLVNENNAPDGWESKVIQAKLINTNRLTGKAQTLDTDENYRYLLPEFYAKGCIQCHGTAKGQEGYSIHPEKIERKVGDFAGAISLRFSKLSE